MAEARSRVRVILIVIGAVLAGLGALAFVLTSIFTPDRIRTEVARAVDRGTGLSLVLGDARLTLFPLAIDLTAVQVAGAAPTDPPALALDSARIRVALPALLRGRIDVETLRFEKPVIILRRDGKGIILPGKLGEPEAAAAERAREGTRGSSGTTTIRRLEITDGTIRLLGPPPEGDLEIRGIDLAARLEISERGDRLQTTGELSLEHLSLDALLPYRETLDELSPKVEFDLDWRQSAGTLAMNSVRLAAGPMDIHGHGNLAGIPDAPRIELVVDPSKLELSDLLPLLPPALIPEGRKPRAKGPIQLAANVSGPLGNPESPPKFAVEIAFEGAELGMEGFPLSLADLKGNVTATDTAIVFKDLRGSLGDGTVRVDGTATGPPDSGRVDLGVVADLDLGLVEKTGFLEEGTTLAGRLDTDMRVTGRTGKDPAPDFRGAMKLADGRVTMPTLEVPLQNLQADLTFEGDAATLRAVSGSLGRSAFHGSGRITNLLKDPYVALHGKCPLLDLIELAPPPDSTAGSTPGSGPAAGATSGPPPLVPELPKIRADLNLVVDSLIAPNTQLADVTLDAQVRNGVAALTAKVARGHFGEGVDLVDLTGNGEMKDGRLNGTFQAVRGVAFKVPMQKVDGKVAVAKRRVDVTDVRAAVFTGSIEGSAIVDMTNPLAPTFEIDSRAKEIQANDFLSTLTPARNVLHGTLNLASKFSGKGLDPKDIAQSLIANGTMDARGGRIESASYTKAIWKTLRLDEKEAIAFKELVAPFSIRGGQLITEKLSVTAADATWRANGAVGFDGVLDYKVEVELSDALADDFRKRAGRDLVNLLAGSSGKVTLDLAIKGPAAHPSVTLDTSRLAKRAAENVKDQAQKGIESLKDRLAGQLGLKTPPAADSAAVTADSAKADSTKTGPPKLEDALKGLFGGK